MRLNILIGGKAGQGINKISEILSNVLVKHGYFTFNYRDYPSLIRGGHNFNVLSLSDKRIGSIESKLDIILALDENTIKIHQSELKKQGLIISFNDFKDLGQDLNIALSGALVKTLGIPEQTLLEEIKSQFSDISKINIVKKGYDSAKPIYSLKKLNNKITKLTGSSGVSIGAINSGIERYIAYPMTPATEVSNELASEQIKNKDLIVFQPENEIAVINMGLGCSFTGKRTMIGSSGGGYDLMSEGLSFQGISEIPLTVYLASRPGPGTGIPTYTSQADLDIALRAGHGDFPRIVIAPGDPIECIEKTNEAMFLSEKFKCLSILLSDKHLAESEFSSDRTPNKTLQVKINRKLPGKDIIKANSYEHNEKGETTESGVIAVKNAENRIKKYNEIKKEISKFQMIKLFGKPSKNLVIGWGSNKTVILDSIENLDCQFLQIIYMKPLSDEIKKYMEKAENIILVESNVTGQLGRLIREKTGLSISKENRILKYDGRPFYSDELNSEIKKRLK